MRTWALVSLKISFDKYQLVSTCDTACVSNNCPLGHYACTTMASAPPVNQHNGCNGRPHIDSTDDGCVEQGRVLASAQHHEELAGVEQ